MNELFTRLNYAKTIVVLKVEKRQDVELISRFFSQDLQGKFTSEIRSEDLVKNEKIMRFTTETSVENIIEQYKKWLKDNLRFVFTIDDVELWNHLLCTKPHLLEHFEVDFYAKIPASKLE